MRILARRDAQCTHHGMELSGQKLTNLENLVPDFHSRQSSVQVTVYLGKPAEGNTTVNQSPCCSASLYWTPSTINQLHGRSTREVSRVVLNKGVPPAVRIVCCTLNIERGQMHRSTLGTKARLAVIKDHVLSLERKSSYQLRTHRSCSATPSPPEAIS